eukprot:5094279-Pleurochrysis_carterae.AAC.1
MSHLPLPLSVTLVVHGAPLRGAPFLSPYVFLPPTGRGFDRSTASTEVRSCTIWRQNQAMQDFITLDPTPIA